MPASMDGAWVGTWRPHRPRGLISAQFPSPGPQYSIPGTTGYVGHSPTKNRAPAYTFRGTKRPAAESCGPGPCYFVEPAITRNGKYVVPGTHLRGRPTTKTTVTPGPSDYRTEAANRHVFKCPPVQSMAFRREPLRTDRPPGPGTYTLPRLMGPNTAYTSASPCYSMRGRSQRGRFDEDLAKTPGPAALPRVAVDVYKTRAPAYTMPARPKQGEGKAVKPGPADYSVGRVRPQLSSSPLLHKHSLHASPPFPEASSSQTASGCRNQVQDSRPAPCPRATSK
ncbi:ciliary microtubule associated protein 1A-like isoform X1 [Excalfactoria chinensis]|uniref:ciliary microtubule associated protein 1A-like isoform X1 n=1 Tax=Excalfactoria chinensis TaxID=46218 RepID=UPI003B3AB0BF